MMEMNGIGNILAAPLAQISEAKNQAHRAELDLQAKELEHPAFETFEYEGRKYILDTTKKTLAEVRPPRDDYFAFPALGSLRGLSETVLRHGDSNNTLITVGTDGIRALLDVRADEVHREARRAVAVPYYDGDNPGEGDMGIEALYGWLDRFNGAMGQSKIDAAEEKAVWTALKTVKASTSDEYEVDDLGGSLSVTFKSKGTVTGSTPIPKYIVVRQRVGVREFFTERLYRLRALLPGKGREFLSFKLTHIVTDGSHERFVEYAVKTLSLQLNGAEPGAGGQWIISEGP